MDYFYCQPSVYYCNVRTKSIDPIFNAALKAEKRRHGHGFQEKLANDVGITPQYVSGLMRGKKYGGEDTRREIARVLGYESYEDFLDIGRKELGLYREKESTSDVSLSFSAITAEQAKDLDGLLVKSEGDGSNPFISTNENK
jgi:transcriptional regulator with XRE-family HTH domain